MNGKDMSANSPWQMLGRRWQALAGRERIALSVLAGFLLLLGFWWGAWLPVQAALRAARANVAEQQALQSHLRANAVALAGRSQAKAAVDAAAVPALLASSAERRGLLIVAPPTQADRQLLLTVQGAPTEIMAWLQELQAAGVATAQLRLSRDAQAGWQGELVLAAAG